jgi:hypothetical protein
MINFVLLVVLSLFASTPTADCGERKLEALTQRSQVVVVAKVTRVEPSLGAWSGYVHFVQHVHYEVEEVLKGALSEREIVVAHSVVKNTATADTKEARLSPDLFAAGNRVVLFLDRIEGKDYVSRDHPPKAWFSLNDDCLPVANATTIDLIRAYAATKP